MGRILLIIFIIAVIVLVWKAFGPGTWNASLKRRNAAPLEPQIKGPDDDEEFLWNLEKQRFKQRRAKEEKEQAEREKQERLDRLRKRSTHNQDSSGDDSPEETPHEDSKPESESEEDSE